jgi:hypothetical protein
VLANNKQEVSLFAPRQISCMPQGARVVGHKTRNLQQILIKKIGSLTEKDMHEIYRCPGYELGSIKSRLLFIWNTVEIIAR